MKRSQSDCFLLTFGEEVGASAVLPDVEVLPQLAAGFEAQHGVVVQAIVPEQDDAPWLQHLEQTQASGLRSCPETDIQATAAGFPEASHPADILQDQLHLVGVDGRQHEDEGDDVHTALGDMAPQVIRGQITLEGAAALGFVQGVLL